MDEPDGGVLSHAAFCYRSQPEYAAAIVAFVQTGLAAGEPTMVAVPGANARAIGDRLDDVPGEVVFTDMAELGRNPARIIPEVRAFLDKHPGQRARFVGEPIWLGRSAAEDIRQRWNVDWRGRTERQRVFSGRCLHPRDAVPDDVRVRQSRDTRRSLRS